MIECLKEVDSIRERVKEMRDECEELNAEANKLFVKAGRLKDEITKIWEPLFVSIVFNNDCVWIPRKGNWNSRILLITHSKEADELIDNIYEIDHSEFNHFGHDFEQWGIHVDDGSLSVWFDIESTSLIKEFGFKVDVSKISEDIEEVEQKVAALKELIEIFNSLK